MILALLLATASPPPPDPGPLRASLLQARGPIASMEACAGVKPRYEGRYARAFGGYIRVAAEADSLFGGEPTLEPLEGPTVPAGCGDRAFADYEAAAEAELAEARRRLGEVTALMPGMWLGTMRICREEVVEAVIEPFDEDNPMSGP